MSHQLTERVPDAAVPTARYPFEVNVNFFVPCATTLLIGP